MRFAKTNYPLILIIVIVINYSPAVSQTSKVPTMTMLTPPAAIQTPVEGHNTIDFRSVPIGTVQFASHTIKLMKGQYLKDEKDDPIEGAVPHQGGQKSDDYKRATDSKCKTAVSDATTCLIIFGFRPLVADEMDATIDIVAYSDDGTTTFVEQLDLTGIGITPQASSLASSCSPPRNAILPTIRLTALPPGTIFPQGSEKLAEEVARDFGDPTNKILREAAINCYFQTNDSLAFFTQFKSIYNGASGGSTIIANIGSYNFSNGMQFSLGTNIQAGSATGLPGTTGSGGLPILSSTSAGQAAQNLFYGGNFYVYDLLPILSKSNNSWDRWHFSAGILGREGVDLQNFSGISTTATSPTTHFNVLGEGYWQYDAIPPVGSKTVPLALFLGV